MTASGHKLIDAAVVLLTRILLLDLQAGGRFPPDVDVIAVAERFGSRYRLLWDELIRTEQVDARERQAHRTENSTHQ